MSTQIYTALGQLSDFLTVAEARLFDPILARRGIETHLTTSREERVTMLTNVLRRINEEGGGITRIQAALGGDDGDLDEFAEALINSGVVEIPEVEISRIRITQVPIGSAPLAYRKLWQGIELLAFRLPPDEPGIDLASGEPTPPRDGYAVLPIMAIAELRKNSEEAAQWFELNKPPQVRVFSFGVEEVEIVRQLS